MLVQERIIDERPRLEFKYKIQSGPSNIKSYGLALARCLRFPSSLIDRAEEISDQLLDDSLIDISKVRSTQRNLDESEPMEIDKEKDSQEMEHLEKDVIDLYSFILMMMTHQAEQKEVDVVNQKLMNLIEKMTLEFREMIKNSSLEDIITVLNATKMSDV